MDIKSHWKNFKAFSFRCSFRCLVYNILQGYTNTEEKTMILHSVIFISDGPPLMVKKFLTCF